MARAESGAALPSVPTSRKRPGFSAAAARTRPNSGACVRWSPRSSTASLRPVKRASSSQSRRVSRVVPTRSRARSGRPSPVPGSAGTARTTVPGASPASASAARSGYRGASRPASAPQTARSDRAVRAAPGAGTRSIRYSGSSASAVSCSAVTGRATRPRTVATGAPSPSARSRRTASLPSGYRLRRSRSVPARCRVTPLQANGSTACPPGRSSRLTCRAASSRAGWRPKAPAVVRAPSGRAASAYSSSPRRHMARRPWKTSP